MLRPYTSQQNEKLYELAKKTNLDYVYKAIKSTRNKSLARSPRSPAIRVAGGANGVCNKLKNYLEPGKKFWLVNKKGISITDKLMVNYTYL